jgi:hypothetical protein
MQDNQATAARVTENTAPQRGDCIQMQIEIEIGIEIEQSTRRYTTVYALDKIDFDPDSDPDFDL